MNCLYTLPKHQYDAVKSNGDFVCVCPKCRYFEERVSIKAIVPKFIYDTPQFIPYMKHHTKPGGY